MVIGNGMIAKEFASYHKSNDFVIFASGVSDSTLASADAFERERNLLHHTIQNNPSKKIVYFSTCSIYDPSVQNSAYVKHKLQMEELVSEKQPGYIIFRLSNPIGKTSNTHTVFNYFIKNITESLKFEVWKNASRNIIDIDDMYTVCNDILENDLFPNQIVNIANPQNYPVPFIVETIEKHFGRKGDYILKDKGDSPHIDITAVEPLFRKFNINFEQHYLPDLLKKYFPLK